MKYPPAQLSASRAIASAQTESIGTLRSAGCTIQYIDGLEPLLMLDLLSNPTDLLFPEIAR